MAYASGTATDYLDLLAKLKSFVNTNADLTGQSPSQAWTIARDTGDALILKGPGTAGNQNIVVGIKTVISASADYYNWELRGFTDYLDTAEFQYQPGASPPLYCHLWNDAIPYWFVANGRRLAWVAKVSTVYQAGYLGYILPYGTPAQYPYPLFVGGTSGESTWRWSETDGGHRMFADPSDGCTQLRYLDGTWQGFSNWNKGYAKSASSRGRYIWPYRDQNDYNLRDNIDGSQPLLPLIPMMDQPADNVMGELDGCFFTSGFNNAVENTITVGADTYLVVQNVFRTEIDQYWALKLA